MVFSSLEFIYLFLPPVLAGFLFLRWRGHEAAIIWWLVGASIAFYAWWSVPYLLLLIGSVVVNYLLHRFLSISKDKAVLTIGIVLNLAALAYFKYANFFIQNYNAISGHDLALLNIVLPLAISFFTFQQISFLCDTYKGQVTNCDFARYALFVVFFPQLIAGPIVLQKDTLPQFKLKVFQGKLSTNLAVGGTLLAIGLFKKIVLADSMAPYANLVFGAAGDAHGIPLEAAWIGALAYTFQIYFDFSGYCDMALGLARLFGIRLPINFNSPYKARSIVDFWRRWHITLSRFLRDYLYIPLGGNQCSKQRRYLNLMLTMLLGGLWHGAAWTFVVWGLLHGLYLTINHAWSAVMKDTRLAQIIPAPVKICASWGVTMIAVIIAWVFFRAESFDAAIAILHGMTGLSTALEPTLWEGLTNGSAWIWLQFLALAIIAVWMPNSIELTARYRPVIDVARELRIKLGQAPKLWQPTPAWSLAIATIAVISIIQMYRIGDLTEFIYFNF
ncbi:MAG: MBOAT family protein [Alphaproteobacteria bacterium]|nr:MBOAT family protein [Alphaproteobacteria bacterium SS10]